MRIDVNKYTGDRFKGLSGEELKALLDIRVQALGRSLIEGNMPATRAVHIANVAEILNAAATLHPLRANIDPKQILRTKLYYEEE